MNFVIVRQTECRPGDTIWIGAGLVSDFLCPDTLGGPMQRPSSFYYGLIGAFVFGLAACGGGGGSGYSSPPPPTTYNLQAGLLNALTTGLTSTVTFSGTVIANGTSVPVTGTGTWTLAPAVATTFNNTSAMSQAETISGTVTANGQTNSYSTSGTSYYVAADAALLGQTLTSEYDVAQSPINVPTSIVGGSNAVLGTLSRYKDSTLSVPLGTSQLSYVATAPVDPASPLSVAITDKIYDANNTLLGTAATTYTLTSANQLTFVSATAQNSDGSLKFTSP